MSEEIPESATYSVEQVDEMRRDYETRIAQLSAQQTEPPAPAPAEAVAATSAMYSSAQLEEIVRAFVQKERSQYENQLQQMQVQIDTLGRSLSGVVPTTIVEHGAGLGG